MCCWLRIRGGASGTLWCNNTIIAEKRILRYFLATLLRLIYILSFYTINALRTQKNGRLLYVLLCGRLCTGRSALSAAEKYRLVHIICTLKKTHTFLVTAPFPHAALNIPLTAQKTPLPFGGGADIVADNINYFSTLFACSIYALLASFAALFASRFTFRKSMYFFVSAFRRLPSLS